MTPNSKDQAPRDRPVILAALDGMKLAKDVPLILIGGFVKPNSQ